MKQLFSKTALLIPTFLSIVLLSGCFSSGHLRKGPYFLQPLPGGIALNDSLWFDRTEVTNIDWLEYLAWLERVYGVEHEEYLAALPDTTAWDRDYGAVGYGEPLISGSIYLRHPAYRNYPVIGISAKQAEDYSCWRSDRVYEALLVRNGVIEYNRDQNPQNHFTIARYQRGDYETFELPDGFMYYPVYRLPTVAEYDLIRKIIHPDTVNKDSATTGTGFRNVMTWKLFLHDSLIAEPVTDIDGNMYRTIRNGNLIWMAENLRVSRFHDGTAIDLLQGDAEWASATTPAFSWNLNLETWPQSATGAYYNWYAVETGKLCPAGWRIPTTEDWELFSSVYGGKAGGAMKVPGYSQWKAPNKGAYNITGFSAWPTGHRVAEGEFYPEGLHAFWWSTSPYSDSQFYSFALSHRREDYRWMLAEKNFGLNIRCVREDKN